MYKKDLVTAVAEKTHDYKRDAEKYVDAILDTIKDALARGEAVRIFGFGKFEVRERKETIARNPKKPQDTYSIPSSKTVKFTAGEKLKKSINR